MKTVVVSLSMLILLLACGKLPEDPNRPRKPILPGTIGTLWVSPAAAASARWLGAMLPSAGGSSFAPGLQL